jgi:PKD repeat protein
VVDTEALTLTEFCPGQTVSVTYIATGSFGLGNTFTAQLSDGTGDFGSFTSIGQVEATGSGTIEAVIPADAAAGAGYRVRVVASSPYTVGTDNGSDLMVHGAPQADFYVGDEPFGSPNPKALTGQPVTFYSTSAAGLLHLWNFGDGASPAMLTDREPVVTYSTTGFKVVSLTVTDGNGCEDTLTMEEEWESLEVYGCNPVIPSTAQVVTGFETTGSGQSAWVCAGGKLEKGGGAYTVYVEPGGEFVFTGGGGYVIYVRAGGSYTGDSGGSSVVIYETGAGLIDVDTADWVFECDTMTFDYSTAPAEGCDTSGPGDQEVDTEALALAEFCPGQTVSVTYIATGSFGLGNTFTAQLSDGTGDFGSFTSIGQVEATGSGTIEAVIPADAAAGAGYRVRVVASSPYTVGTDNGSDLMVHGAPQADFYVGDEPFGSPNPKALTGQPVTFYSTSAAGLLHLWNFGDGASPAMLTDREPVVTYSTTGFKVVSLTVTDGNGCEDTLTMEEEWESLEVYGCNPVIPSTAQVVTGFETTGSGQSAWVCAGGKLEKGGGAYTVYVEPGGEFVFTGGGGYVIYVRAGGSYTGDSGGSSVVIYETGAGLIDIDTADWVFECDTMTFDYSTAPAEGCP